MLKELRFYLGGVPRDWFVPRSSRLALALICVAFWTGTILNALLRDTAHASVFSLFGLGLLYLVFSLFNLFGGLKSSLSQHRKGLVDESHPRMLLELFLVLGSMLIFNIAVLVIYVFKGASFTPVDGVSVGIDIVLLVILLGAYGYKELFSHPIARGWLAVAGKTIPQLVTAVLFLLHPSAATGLALVTLLGIDALSALRFFPTLRSYRRDRESKHLKGLLLGEAGNTISGLLLSVTWLIAHLR